MPLLTDEQIGRIKAKDLSGLTEADLFLRDKDGFSVLYHIISTQDPDFLRGAIDKLGLSPYVFYGDPIHISVSSAVIINTEAIKIKPDTPPKYKEVKGKYTILHGPIDHVADLINKTLLARSAAAIERQATYKEQTQKQMDLFCTLLSCPLQADDRYFEMLVANAIAKANEVYNSDKELNGVIGGFTSILCGIDALDVLKEKINSYIFHARETGGYEQDSKGERQPLMGFVPWYFFPIRIFLTLRILIEIQLGKGEGDEKLPDALKKKHHNDFTKVRQELVQTLMLKLQSLLSSYWLTRSAYYSESLFKNQKFSIEVESTVTAKVKQELDALDSERKKLNLELTALRGNEKSLNQQLKSLKAAAKKRNTKLELSEAKVKAKEAEIEGLEVKIATKRSEFDHVIDQLASKRLELKKLTEENDRPHIISMVEGLIKQIKSLKDNDSSVVYLAWQGHALYLQIHKVKGQYNLLIHNLGDLNDWHEKGPEEKTRYPYKLGKLDEKAWDKDQAGYRYLLEIHKTLYPLQSSNIARPIYYDRSSDPSQKLLKGPYVAPITEEYSALAEQVEENCVYHGERACDVITFSGYYDWVRRRELAIGGPLSRKDFPDLKLPETLAVLSESKITKIPPIITSKQNGAGILSNLANQLKSIYRLNYSSLPPLFKDDEEEAKKGVVLSMKDFYLDLELQSQDPGGMNDKVSLEDLMVYEKEQLFVGQLGVGKSTLMRRIAYQWATEDSFANDFDLVVLLPLKKLRHIKIEGKDLQAQICDCLWKVLFKINEVDDTLREQLAAKIFDKSVKIRWLLDGYDEVYTNLDPTAQKVLDTLREQDYVFTTTRPVALEKMGENKPRVEIKGLGDEDIHDWVNDYKDLFAAEAGEALSSAQKAQADEKAKKLLVFLHKPKIWELVHIPIHLRMVCEAMISGDLDLSAESHIDSHTKLYEVFVKALAKRYYNKGLEEDSSIAVRYTSETYWAELEPALCQIAYDILDKRGQEIALGVKHEEIVHASMPLYVSNYDRNWVKEIIRCGVLQSAEDAGGGVTKEFLHSSYGEYFAAKHIISKIKSNFAAFSEWFHKNKHEKRYEEVWGFVSGLIDDQALADQWFQLWFGEPSKMSLEDLKVRLSDKLIEYIEVSNFSSTLNVRERLVELLNDYCSKGGSISALSAHVLKLMQALHLWDHPASKAWAEKALNIQIELDSIEKAVGLFESYYASDPAKLAVLLDSFKKEDLNLREKGDKELSKLIEKERSNAKKHEQRFLTAIVLLRAHIGNDEVIDQVKDCLVWCKWQINVDLLRAAIQALKAENTEMISHLETDYFKLTSKVASGLPAKKRLVQAIELLAEICTDKEKIFDNAVKNYLFSEEDYISSAAMKTLEKLEFTKEELIAKLSDIKFSKSTKQLSVIQITELLLNHAAEESIPYLVNILEKLIFTKYKLMNAGSLLLVSIHIQPDILKKFCNILDKDSLYPRLAVIELLTRHNIINPELISRVLGIVEARGQEPRLREAALKIVMSNMAFAEVRSGIANILFGLKNKISDYAKLQKAGITRVSDKELSRDIVMVLSELTTDFNRLMLALLGQFPAGEYDDPVWIELLKLPYDLSKPEQVNEEKFSLRELRKKVDVKLTLFVDSVEVIDANKCKLIVGDKSFVVSGKKESEYWRKKFSIETEGTSSTTPNRTTPMDLDDNSSEFSGERRSTGNKRKAAEISRVEGVHAFFPAMLELDEDPFAFDGVSVSQQASRSAAVVHSNKKARADASDRPGRFHLDYTAFLQELASKYGMNRQKVKGDGNCQFTAVAIQLQTKDPVKFFNLKNAQPKDSEADDIVLVARRLRALAVEHIRANHGQYSDIINVEIGTAGVNFGQDKCYGTVDDYCNEMAKDMVFGDEFTLRALAKVLLSNIVVLDSALFEDEKSLDNKIYRGNLAKPLSAKSSLLIAFNRVDHYDTVANEPNEAFEALLAKLPASGFSLPVASAAASSAVPMQLDFTN